jgi:hypothetical protein
MQTVPLQHAWVVQLQSLALHVEPLPVEADTAKATNTPATTLKIIFFILIVFDFE